MRTKKQQKNQKRKNAIISVVLILSLLITGIFAFLWSSDSKTNRFTVGKVDIVLHEEDWYDNNGNVLNDENNNGVPDFAENLVPGQEIPKAPYVENTGKNPAHVFLVVGVPVEEWDNIFTANGTYNGAEANDIIVQAYGIQENYAGLVDSEQIWNSYVSKTGIASMFGEKTTSTDNIELFTCVGMNEENWEQMKVLSDYSNYDPNATDVPTLNIYQGTVKDPDNEENSKSYNYYFFKYKNANNNAILDVNSVTNELFTAVKLIDGIGEKEIKPYTIKFYTKNNTTSEISNTEPVKASYLAKSDNILTSDVEAEVDKSEYTEVHSITAQGEYKLDTLPMELNQYKEGCLFDWVKADVDNVNNKFYLSGKAAYAGMTFNEDMATNGEINFIGINEDISNGENAAKYLTFHLTSNNITGEVSATIDGANPNGEGYPSSPTTVVIPNFILIKVHYGQCSAILNGYCLETMTGYLERYVPSMRKLPSEYQQTSGEDIIYHIPVKEISVHGSAKTNTPTAVEERGNALLSVAQELVIPNGVTGISYCGNRYSDITETYSELTKINIPYSCDHIGTNGIDSLGLSYGLRGNPKLSNIIIPNTIKVIGTECFANTNIQSLELPDSLEVIARDAFINSKITNLTVPAFVTSIFFRAFNGIDTVSFKGLNWTFQPSHDIINTNTYTYVPSVLGCKNIIVDDNINGFKNSKAYVTLNFVGAFNTSLNASVPKIGVSSIIFNDNSCLAAENKILCNECSHYYWADFGCECNKEDVLYINNKLIAVSNNITSLNIPNNITSIGEYAFWGCAADKQNVSNITIPNSITSIERGAFKNYMGVVNISQATYNNIIANDPYVFWTQQTSGKLNIT